MDAVQSVAFRKFARMGETADFIDLMTEAEALETYPFLGKRELHAARLTGEIGYYAMGQQRNRILYSHEQVQDYIASREVPSRRLKMPAAPTNTADTGSGKKSKAKPTTDIGTSSEDERSAAAHLALVIGKKPSERK